MSEPTLARRGRSDTRWALVFLAPNLIGFLVFVALPVVFSLVMAFTNWDLIEREPLAFVGLENFRNMLWGPESRNFWKFFVNTVYLMLGIPVAIAGSLFLAVMLSDPIRFGSRLVWVTLMTGSALMFMAAAVLCVLPQFATAASPAEQAALGRIQTIGLILAIVSGSSLVAVAFNRVGFRTIFYLPFFTTGVAQFILWKLMFRPDSGPINEVLRTIFVTFGLDIEPPGWLGSTANLLFLDPQTGRPVLDSSNFGLGARDAIVIMGIWASVGGNNMLLYLAGLSNVPGELYEAATIDGAGRWRTFWNVSWPQLAPTTFFIVVMSVIGGLQGGFEQARVMTEGRPADTTITLGYYIYNEGFAEFRLGYASAVAWMLFLMIFVVTLINWRFGSKQLNV